MAVWLFDNPERWEEVREGTWSSSKQSKDAPELTPVSIRFADDVNAFFSLFAGDEPVKLLVRGKISGKSFMVSATPVALALAPRSLKREMKTRYTFVTEDGVAT